MVRKNGNWWMKEILRGIKVYLTTYVHRFRLYSMAFAAAAPEEGKSLRSNKNAGILLRCNAVYQTDGLPPFLVEITRDYSPLRTRVSAPPSHHPSCSCSGVVLLSYFRFFLVVLRSS